MLLFIMLSCRLVPHNVPPRHVFAQSDRTAARSGAFPAESPRGSAWQRGLPHRAAGVGVFQGEETAARHHRAGKRHWGQTPPLPTPGPLPQRGHLRSPPCRKRPAPPRQPPRPPSLRPGDPPCPCSTAPPGGHARGSRAKSALFRAALRCSSLLFPRLPPTPVPPFAPLNPLTLPLCSSPLAQPPSSSFCPLCTLQSPEGRPVAPSCFIPPVKKTFNASERTESSSKIITY